MPKNRKFAKWRPDKICTKIIPKEGENEKYLIKPIDIQKIGAFAIQPYEDDEISEIEIDGIVRTPSDHMGLIIDVHLTCF